MMDERTRGVLEGLVDCLDACRANLAMYAHHPDIPALRSAEFWLRETRRFLAQGTEAQRAATVKQGAVHDGPVGNADAPKPGHSGDTSNG